MMSCCNKKLLMLLFNMFLLLTSPSLAQDVSDVGIAVPQNTLSESFDRPKVAAATLVGVSLGEFRGFVDVERIFITFPGKGKQRICVEVKTQDARYSAINSYSLNSDRNLKRVRLSPVTIHYEKDLAKYRKTSFAIKSYVQRGKICNPNKALLLPQLGTGTNTNKLIALVNSQSRITTAALSKVVFSEKKSDKNFPAVARTKCVEHDEAVAVAFDKICRLDISGELPAGVLYLRISLDDGFGIEKHVSSVLLPAFE